MPACNRMNHSRKHGIMFALIQEALREHLNLIVCPLLVRFNMVLGGGKRASQLIVRYLLLSTFISGTCPTDSTAISLGGMARMS